MSRGDRSTRIRCVAADCPGSYGIVRAEQEIDDELVCGVCQDSWTRPTWPVLGQLARTRRGDR